MRRTYDRAFCFESGPTYCAVCLLITITQKETVCVSSTEARARRRAMATSSRRRAYASVFGRAHGYRPGRSEKSRAARLVSIGMPISESNSLLKFHFSPFRPGGDPATSTRSGAGRVSRRERREHTRGMRRTVQVMVRDLPARGTRPREASICMAAGLLHLHNDCCDVGSSFLTRGVSRVGKHLPSFSPTS